MSDDYAKYHCFGFNPERPRATPALEREYNGSMDDTIKEEIQMIKRMPNPMFNLGQVIDLSYKNGGLPNRILVIGLFVRETDDMWQYNVIMENTGDKANMDEKFIRERQSKHVAAVYKNPAVMDRMKEGWRFCGNMNEANAMANAKLLAEKPGVYGVRLYPAISADNRYIRTQKGVWIRYETVLADDGSSMAFDNGDGMIIVK